MANVSTPMLIQSLISINLIFKILGDGTGKSRRCMPRVPWPSDLKVAESGVIDLGTDAKSSSSADQSSSSSSSSDENCSKMSSARAAPEHQEYRLRLANEART